MSVINKAATLHNSSTETRSYFFANNIIINTKTDNMTNGNKETLLFSITIIVFVINIFPNIINIIVDITAHIKEIFSLCFNVSYILTFIVFVEIIVVSEIGDKLSPKKLPQTIAPNIKAGLQFNVTDKGKNIGTAIEIVPVDVPINVEIRQQITNIIAGKNSALKPIFIKNFNSESEIPDIFNIFDKIPANINIRIHVNNVSFFIFSMHFFPKCFLSFDIINVINIDIKPLIRNVFKDALLHITKEIILAIKNIMGIIIIKFPK